MNRRAGMSTTRKVTQLVNVEEHAEGFRQVRGAYRRELIDGYAKLIPDLIIEVDEARQMGMAVRLGVSQPTVVKVLKRLALVGLIKTIPWRGVSSTAEGERLAQESRGCHQIVGNFPLMLGISPEITRHDVEGMEHHASKETLEAFSRFMQQQEIGSERVFLYYVPYNMVVFSSC